MKRSPRGLAALLTLTLAWPPVAWAAPHPRASTLRQVGLEEIPDSQAELAKDLGVPSSVMRAHNDGALPGGVFTPRAGLEEPRGSVVVAGLHNPTSVMYHGSQGTGSVSVLEDLAPQYPLRPHHERIIQSGWIIRRFGLTTGQPTGQSIAGGGYLTNYTLDPKDHTLWILGLDRGVRDDGETTGHVEQVLADGQSVDRRAGPFTSPTALAIDLRRRILAVVESPRSGGRVTFVNLRTLKRTEAPPPLTGLIAPYAVAFNPENSDIVVAEGTGGIGGIDRLSRYHPPAADRIRVFDRRGVEKLTIPGVRAVQEMVVGGGTLFVTDTKRVRAFDARSGEEQWVNEELSEPSGVAFMPPSTVLVVEHGTGRLLALSARDGTPAPTAAWLKEAQVYATIQDFIKARKQVIPAARLEILEGIRSALETAKGPEQNIQVWDVVAAPPPRPAPESIPGRSNRFRVTVYVAVYTDPDLLKILQDDATGWDLSSEERRAGLPQVQFRVQEYPQGGVPQGQVALGIRREGQPPYPDVPTVLIPSAKFPTPWQLYALAVNQHLRGQTIGPIEYVFEYRATDQNEPWMALFSYV